MDVGHAGCRHRGRCAIQPRGGSSTRTPEFGGEVGDRRASLPLRFRGAECPRCPARRPTRGGVGSADLVRLDAAGRKRWLMQADEVLYLHTDRVRLQGPAIDVDADPLPDDGGGAGVCGRGRFPAAHP